ncbi:MAG: hypothetical protein WD009_03370 [Phycisphaeraceae bacterium]
MRDFLSCTAVALTLAGLALASGCDDGETSADASASPAATTTPATTSTGDADTMGGEVDGETLTAIEADMNVFSNLRMNDLLGDPVDLASRYAGRAVVVVNVASKCGHTPQYAALQELHERYSEQGLAIVGVPSGDFGGQEFDSAEEIVDFCQSNYGVAFDMLEKSHVRGEEQIELFQRLTHPDIDPIDGGEPAWNFEKFVIDRDGRVIARYRSRTQPTSDEMIQSIEQALGGTAG